MIMKDIVNYADTENRIRKNIVYMNWRVHMIKKIKKRLWVSMLIVPMILSQIVPAVVSAEAKTNTGILDEFAKEIGIEIKKEPADKSSIEFLIKDATSNMPSIRNDKIYRMGVPAVYGKGNYYGGYHLISPYAFNFENKSIYSGYSRDGRLYTTGTTAGNEYINGEWVQKPNLDMKWYPTVKYFSEQHPKLKDNLDNYFAEENLFRIASIVPNGPNGQYWFGEHKFGSPLKYGRDTLSSAIYYKDSVYNALKSKTQRAELAKIAVENGLIDDEKHVAAPYLALFTYYGILNQSNDLLSYDSGSKAYLSREQADLMLGRFMKPETYFEAGKEMKEFPHYYTKAMLISGSGKKPITAKELSSSITKLELIYMITETFFKEEINECSDAFVIEKSGEFYLEDNTFWSAKAFNDIDKGDQITDAWKKASKITDKTVPNDVARKMIKDKKLSSDDDDHIQVAYKICILEKDSKGNANLFQKVSYSEAIIMLAKTGLAQADQKTGN
jgi:hypothetical protein